MMHSPQRRGTVRARRRPFLTAGVATVATVALVAGCSSADGEDGGDGGDGESQALTIWANTAFVGDGDSPLQQAADAFAEEHDVEITLQGVAANDLAPNLITTVSGGRGPDVAIVDSSFIPQLAAGEVIQDVTDRAGDLEGDFHEGAWQYSQYQGQQFGLPVDSSNTALFYNVQMLEDAGVEVPTTWEELVDAATALTDPENDQYGYMLGAQGYGAFSFWPFLWQNGGQIADENATEVLFNDAAGHEAFEFYSDLALVHEVAPPEFPTVSSSWDEYVAPFVQERVAMMVIGPWGIDPIESGNPDLEFAVAPLPQGKEAATILGGSSITMGANSANPDLAWEFIEWFTAGEQMHYIQDMGRIPGNAEVLDSEWAQEDPIRQVFVEQMPIARARPANPLWGDVEWGSFASAWDSVIQGQKDPAQALDDAAEAAATSLTSN